MPETPEAAFERGHVAGATVAELHEHSTRLDALNGSIARHSSAIEQMTLAVQALNATTTANHKALVAQMAAAAEAVRTTAAALAAADAARIAAETARRTKSERSWTPMMRMGLVIGVAVGLASLVTSVVALWPS